VSLQKGNVKKHMMRKHSDLKKGGDDMSDISEHDEQPVANKECRMCINYKQLIEMKDSRIADLEKMIELLEKDTKIAVLETKLDARDMMVDMSGNFIEKQQHTIDNVIQMKQTQPTPQAKGRTKKADADDDDALVLPKTIVAEAPKPIKKKALTKEELKMRDYHEDMNEINEKMKTVVPAKSKKPREIDVDYLNEVCSNAEPFENLIERVFENTKYFEKNNLSEEQLMRCKMTKIDYNVGDMLKFQDFHLKPSKANNAIMEYQVDLQSKEKFYNSLFIKAFETQDVKSFYYVKKSKQSFIKLSDSWKICENEDIQGVMKRLEKRIFTVASNAVNMLFCGVIPASRYGYNNLNYTALTSDKGISVLPENERKLKMDLMNQYRYGLMESCNNERMSDILFKQIKMTYDPKAFHNSDVSISYDKEKEMTESDVADNKDEEED
jgi:hypothetical protein